MIANDPLLTELEDANPVPRTAKPGAQDWIEADRVLQRVLTAPPRRPRSWPVLAPVASALVVVAVVAAAFSVGGPSTSGTAKHGLQIVLQAEPTPQSPAVTPAELSRTVVIVRKRLDALTPGFSVNAVGADRVVVTGRHVGAAEQARITALASETAQLDFYDWEADVLTPNGKTVASQLQSQDPTAVQISQGTQFAPPGDPNAGSMPLYQAVQLASKQPKSVSPHNARLGPQYYLFGAPGSAACAAVASSHGTIPTAGQHCLLAGPQDETYSTSHQQVVQDLTSQLPSGVTVSDGELLTVQQGTVVLQAQSPSATAFTGPAARFFVLRDRAELTGAEITKPQESTDSGGNPDVEFGFNSKGATAFQNVTAQIAQRGQQVSTLGQTYDQHFAVALDNQLVTVPSIDYKTYPDGITGGNGADITGGFTTRSARNLAVELRYGVLPLNLRLVR